jgi:hypothetical protein
VKLESCILFIIPLSESPAANRSTTFGDEAPALFPLPYAELNALAQLLGSGRRPRAETEYEGPAGEAIHR